MADKEEKREHEYELMSYGAETESLGKVWWNGKKIETDEPTLLQLLKSQSILVEDKELTVDDGVEFLKGLPMAYRSYISARKV